MLQDEVVCVRALVVGCGYMGRIHSANLWRLGVEVIQYDIVRERCSSYIDRVCGHSIDLVVIATPIKTHYQVFLELYGCYGKNVVYLIEKPVTETLEQFQEIVGIDAEIFVGHQLRYSKFYEMIKREIEVSSTFSVEMNVYSPSDPGVGLILDTGIHFIDLPVYYLGPPKDFEFQGDRNSFNLVLHYDKGVWRIKGELKDYYRIEFSVNERKGVSDGVSLVFNGNLFQDVDVYYEEMRDVVNYILNRREKPRISLQKLIKTYELAFEIIDSLH